MSECIWEKSGSKKYVLKHYYYNILHFGAPVDIDTGYCVFLPTGSLHVNAGYEWDGPSGPAIDTDNFMDGSLVHDVLYQLMREGHLSPVWKWRTKADKEMRIQTKRDGMSLPRRWWTWLGVRVGGGSSAKRNK